MADDDERDADGAQPERRRPPVPRVPTGTRMHCPDCGGAGAKLVERMTAFGGMPGHGGQAQQCKTCQGVGKLNGFQPPV